MSLGYRVDIACSWRRQFLAEVADLLAAWDFQESTTPTRMSRPQPQKEPVAIATICE